MGCFYASLNTSLDVQVVKGVKRPKARAPNLEAHWSTSMDYLVLFSLLILVPIAASTYGASAIAVPTAAFVYVKAEYGGPNRIAVGLLFFFFSYASPFWNLHSVH